MFYYRNSFCMKCSSEPMCRTTKSKPCPLTQYSTYLDLCIYKERCCGIYLKPPRLLFKINMLQMVVVGKATLPGPFSLALRQPHFHLPSLRCARCFTRTVFMRSEGRLLASKARRLISKPFEGFLQYTCVFIRKCINTETTEVPEIVLCFQCNYSKAYSLFNVYILTLPIKSEPPRTSGAAQYFT